MTTTTTIHRSLAALKLPNAVPALITYAQGVVRAMTGNTAFPSPMPTLAGEGDWSQNQSIIVK